MCLPLFNYTNEYVQVFSHRLGRKITLTPIRTTSTRFSKFYTLSYLSQTVQKTETLVLPDRHVDEGFPPLPRDRRRDIESVYPNLCLSSGTRTEGSTPNDPRFFVVRSLKLRKQLRTRSVSEGSGQVIFFVSKRRNVFGTTLRIGGLVTPR